MSQNKLLIEEYDDWIKIYDNGELVYENHSISTKRLLELIGINFEYEVIDDEEEDD